MRRFSLKEEEYLAIKREFEQDKMFHCKIDVIDDLEDYVELEVVILDGPLANLSMKETFSKE